MKRRQLGRSGIEVTELGFGGAPLGGLLAAVDGSDAHGVELPVAALQFPLRDRSVACVVAGMRSAQELHENVRRLRASLPAELWGELEREALREHASRR